SLAILLCPPPTSTLFPFTTLFRSHQHPPIGSGHQGELLAQRLHRHAIPDDAIARARVRLEAGVLDLQAAVRQRVLGHYRHLEIQDRKSTRLNSSHLGISYAVFCLK